VCLLTLGIGALGALWSATSAGVAAAAAPALTLSAAPAQVLYGAKAKLTVGGAMPGSSLALSHQPAGQTAFAPLAQLVADAGGAAVWSGTPEQNTTYRVEFAGDAVWEAAAAEAAVAVRPRVGLYVSRASGYPGQAVKLKVGAFPYRVGEHVTIEVSRRGGWQPWRTVTLGKRSRATIVWKPRRRGSYRFRASLAAGPAYAAGLSRRRAVRIKRANPYGVPVGPAHFILTDRSQYRLYYFEHGVIVRVFNCVLGRPGLETPLGRFRVYGRGYNPGGPFGVRVLWYHGGHGIHGTNQPWLLGHFPRNYSHGCTRLANANALWLFNRCPVGTPVWNVL